MVVEVSVLLNNVVRSGELVQHKKEEDHCTNRDVDRSVTPPGWLHNRCAG